MIEQDGMRNLNFLSYGILYYLSTRSFGLQMHGLEPTANL